MFLVDTGEIERLMCSWYKEIVKYKHYPILDAFKYDLLI